MRNEVIRTGRRALSAGMALALFGCSYGAEPDRKTDFVLLFHGDATELDRDGRALLDRAAASAAVAAKLDVTVAGYADPPMSPESNQIRSRIRAQTIADGLVARGVARSRITVAPRRGLGADPGSESARVEIRIGS